MDDMQKIEFLKIPFATNSYVARRRYLNWQRVDPYPDIGSGLLDSAAIIDYVNEASLVFPLDPDNLKTCAFELTLGDSYLCWDESGKKKFYHGLKKGTPIWFPHNSIVYVTTLEEIQVPYYLAFRFNLVIPHVHKGMLLGTGPLVNPGFFGKLMIPIHNFTRNDYSINVGEDLISVEVTKISNYKSPGSILGLMPVRHGFHISNYSKYINASFDEFIKRAIGPDGRVQNAIGQALADMEHKINNAVASSKNSTQRVIDDASVKIGKLEDMTAVVRKWSLAGAVGVILTLAGLFVALYSYHLSMYQTINSFPDRERYIAEEYKSEMRRQQSELEVLKRDLREKNIGQKNLDKY